MSTNPEQFAGGALPHAGSMGEVRSDCLDSPLHDETIAIGSTEARAAGAPGVPGRRKSGDCALLLRSNWPVRWVLAEEFGCLGGRWHAHGLVSGVERMFFRLGLQRWHR